MGDQPVIDSAHSAEMRGSLGTDGYGMLLARFMSEAEALLDWLDNAPDHTPGEVQSRCHKVAGSAAVFGATAFRAGLLAIETGPSGLQPAPCWPPDQFRTTAAPMTPRTRAISVMLVTVLS
jgi:hypothetical protein